MVGPWVPLEETEISFSLTVNGEIRQKASSKEMFVQPSAALKLVKDYFPVCSGDILFTGTPTGVQSVIPGDKAHVGMGGLSYFVEWG